MSVRQLNRLVRQTNGATLQHGLCQLFLACKMEIREQQLPFPNQFVLGLDGLFYFDNHFRFAVHVFDSRQDLRTNFQVLVVAEAAAFSCCVLNHHGVAVFNHFRNAGRCHSYSVLVVLDLFWNTDFHMCMCLMVVVAVLFSGTKLQQIFHICNTLNTQNARFFVVKHIF